MKWYFQIRGGHTHVRVFMNGGKCGDLCFRNEEFQLVREIYAKANYRAASSHSIHCIDETPATETTPPTPEK